MEEELRGYLEAAVEQRMRSGMSAEEARRVARAELGSLESVKDEIRSAGWEAAVEAFWRDIRYSVRVLAKSPAFTAVVVLTLALGIGANTAIFSLVDAILLRYLPVVKPEELVEVSHTSFTNPLWEQVRDRQDVFSGVFAWSADRFNLTRGGAVQYANGLWASGDFFRTLGLTRGRQAPDSRRRPAWLPCACRIEPCFLAGTLRRSRQRHRQRDFLGRPPVSDRRRGARGLLRNGRWHPVRRGDSHLRRFALRWTAVPAGRAKLVVASCRGPS